MKILSGRISLADFVFAKEVRLGTYSGKGPAPPAAIVSAKAMAQDPRAEPRFSERVPYVVVHGAPGSSSLLRKSCNSSKFLFWYDRGWKNGNECNDIHSYLLIDPCSSSTLLKIGHPSDCPAPNAISKSS